MQGRIAVVNRTEESISRIYLPDGLHGRGTRRIKRSFAFLFDDRTVQMPKANLELILASAFRDWQTLTCQCAIDGEALLPGNNSEFEDVLFLRTLRRRHLGPTTSIRGSCMAFEGKAVRRMKCRTEFCIVILFFWIFQSN
jgi:hypothetical protein